MATSKFFFVQDMAIFFFKISKIPLLDSPASFLFVARLRKFAKKRINTGWNLLLSKYGDITIFFPWKSGNFQAYFPQKRFV